jgi:hypothetical protein|tara:strand:+ start:241 stop:480 length:240 start_codon:yes stop_codon:yes gene_type:complete
MRTHARKHAQRDSTIWRLLKNLRPANILREMLEEGPGGGKKVEELDKRESVGAARRRRKGVPEAPAARHVIVESISPRR